MHTRAVLLLSLLQVPFVLNSFTSEITIMTCLASDRGRRCLSPASRALTDRSAIVCVKLTTALSSSIADSKWCSRHEELQAKSLKSYKVRMVTLLAQLHR